MVPSVVLITQPSIDFDTLLSLGNQMLGRSLSAKVDASHKAHSDTGRVLSCLAAMRDDDAPAGLTPNLHAFASFGILIGAEERDLIQILEAAAMPFVQAESIQRGLFLCYVYGSLAQWRDAVKTGASQTSEFNVRACYCKIMSLFEKAGLGEAWKDYTAKPMKDQTFFLEDKRK